MFLAKFDKKKVPFLRSFLLFAYNFLSNDIKQLGGWQCMHLRIIDSLTPHYLHPSHYTLNARNH